MTAPASTEATGRRTARVVGVLFLVATAAGGLSVAVTEPVLSAGDLLADVSAHKTQVLLGALLVLVMGVAVVGVSVAAYPVLRRRSQALALGYVASRTVEAMLYALGAISLVSLVVLSEQYVAAPAPDATTFGAMAEVLVSVREWGAAVVLDTAVFPVGALILYSLLYQARLVPRWLSAWGLVGAVLYLAGGVLLALDLTGASSAPLVLSNVPLAVNELVLAVWLIAKGFSAPAAAPQPLTDDALARG